MNEREKVLIEAKEKAKIKSELLWSVSAQKEREAAFNRLTRRYFLQHVSFNVKY